MSPFSNRVASNVANKSISVLAVTLSLSLLYYAHTVYAVQTRHANIVLGLSLAIYYITLFRDSIQKNDDPDVDIDVSTRQFGMHSIGIRGRLTQTIGESHLQKAKEAGVVLRRILYLALAVLALISAAYIELRFQYLQNTAPIIGYTTTDLIIGAIVIILVTDVTLRAFGKWIAGVVVLGILYGLAGPYLPGIFFHTGLSIQQIIQIGAIGLGGVFGFILEVGATWVAVFLLLAGFAKAFGIIDYMMEVSKEVSKKAKTGIVHVAIIASLGMGSITGSGVANTATTGSFTIPMMKDQGVDKAYAGAIETLASIGGQLVPPIMGIAAFIMADLIGVPYLRIIQAGLIPAILFYLSIVISVQIMIYKHGWTTPTSGDIKKGIFLESIYYLIPLAILIYLLAIARYTPLRSGYYTILSTIGIIFIKSLIDQGPPGVKDASLMTIDGLRQGAIDMASLMAVLGSIGVVIAVFTQTGFAQRLSNYMIGLSGESMFILLILAMIVSLAFGLGMPAPAAYILTASLAAVAMTDFGIQVITAHMFVFYFAMYSSLTPPVGPSTIVAAQLADAEYAETAKQCMRLAIPGFLVPFIFITNDSLIYWELPITLYATTVAIISIIAICIVISGHNGRYQISRPTQGLYLALTLLSLFGPIVNIYSSSLLQLGLGIILLSVMISNYFNVQQIVVSLLSST